MHTPTPWKLEYDPTARGNCATVIMQEGAQIYEKFIAEARWGKDGGTDHDGDGVRDCTAKEAQANAKFIVRACNAFDDMLSALESLTDPEGHIWHGNGSCECTGECKAVRAAISKAKGES